MKHALLLMLFTFLLACNPVREIVVADAGGVRTVRLGPQNRPGGVFFAVQADAGTYALTVSGSFNQWHPTQYPLTNAGAVWSGFVPLNRNGRIEFRYIRNGHEWFTDPLTETVTDRFGGRSSVFFARPDITSG